jgi:hypothetical protein
MNILEELKKYPLLRFYEDKVMKALKTPMEYCPEDISTILPSIVLGSDGPILSSLFFVTQNLLCEVRSDSKNQDFDFIARNRIFNYRFKLSEHAMTQADKQQVSYKIAQVTLNHNPESPRGLTKISHSQLSYVGTDEAERELWLKEVTKALPLSLLVPNQEAN